MKKIAREMKDNVLHRSIRKLNDGLIVSHFPGIAVRRCGSVQRRGYRFFANCKPVTDGKIAPSIISSHKQNLKEPFARVAIWLTGQSGIFEIKKSTDMSLVTICAFDESCAGALLWQ